MAPDDPNSVWINQDAWLSLGNFTGGFSTSYSLKKPGNGVYAFTIDGNVTINDQSLFKRDAIGIWDIDKVDISAGTDAKILLIEVPMNEE